MAERMASMVQTKPEDQPALFFGNEEVESSILSRSTINYNDLVSEKEVLRGSREPRGF